MIVPLHALMAAVVLTNAPVVQSVPQGFDMWKTSELERRDAALATSVGPVGNRSSRETLADFGAGGASHRFRLIRRESDGMDAHPEIHDDIEDVVFIRSGEATLLVGGQMINRRGDGGDGIEGAVRYPVAAGDLIHIPAATPHGYLVPEGGHVTYVLLRLPAFVGQRAVSTDARPVENDPPGFALWSAAELAERDAALFSIPGRDQEPGVRINSSRETLGDFGSGGASHRFRLILSTGNRIPEQHLDIEDVVFIVSGDGMVEVGGEMINSNGVIWSGGGFTDERIVNGTRYPVGTGDIIHIPANTAHGYMVPQPGRLTYVLVRVPAFVAP